MNRRTLVSALAGGLVAAPFAVQTQQPGRVYRVGVIASRSLLADRLDAFEQKLATLGYVKGQNLVLEYPGVARDEDGARYAAELVALRVDVIVAPTPPIALAAKRATTTIPIVMLNVGDPVAIGLVDSFARPGGNVTGLTLTSAGLYAKHLQLLHEALPNIARVGVFWNASSPTGPAILKEIEDAAPLLHLKLHTAPVRSPEGLPAAFAAIAEARAQALLVVPDGRFWADRVRIAELALQYKLPTMFGLREHVIAGGFMAYGASTFDGYPRAAVYVDKILRGAKPADMPIEQPTKFELVINLKTAKALGITIPQTLLLRADEVLE